MTESKRDKEMQKEKQENISGGGSKDEIAELFSWNFIITLFSLQFLPDSLIERKTYID